MKKTKLLFLFPGPKYYLQSTLGKRFQSLSEKYEGTIFTTPHGDCPRLASFAVRTVAYQYTSQLKHNIYYLIGAIKLARELKNEGVDIVVSYDPLVTGLVSYIVSRYLGAKLIVEINGDFTHPAIYHEQKSKLSASIKKFIFKAIAKFVIHRSNGVKLLYKSQIDWVDMKNYKGQILVAPDFVDIEPFIKSVNKFEESNTILVIGFPFYIKGIDIIIEAFKSIEAEFPHWHLKILGWYPKHEQITSLIGDSKNIKLKKAVPYSEMIEQIGSAKIIAQPSRTEAMGRALVESAAAKKARIGSNVGGIPTVIKHNVTGLIVEPDSIEDLTKKLVQLMSNEKLRVELGTAAQSFAKKHHSLDSYIKSNDNFYQAVLKE